MKQQQKKKFEWLMIQDTTLYSFMLLNSSMIIDIEQYSAILDFKTFIILLQLLNDIYDIDRNKSNSLVVYILLRVHLVLCKKS